MSQLRSPIRKYSIFSESSFPIKVSKGEKIPIGESVSYLFYHPTDEKIKTWPLRFPAKENPNTEKARALFDWLVVLQYKVKASYRLMSRKFA